MSNAQQIYNDNAGHTHGAAVEAVYSAGVEDGKLLGSTVTETVTLDPNPELSTKLDQAQHDLVSEQAANALLVEQNKDQEAKLEASTVSSNEAASKINELEAQIEALNAEIEALKKQTM